MADHEDDNIPDLPAYNDGARKIGTVRMPITSEMVEEISPEERRVLEAQRTCGECRHFDYAAGQAEMKATKFLQRLTDKQEYAWQLRHLAAPANQMGFCGAYNSGEGGEDRTLTAKLNSADRCDMFRPNEGLVTLRRKTTDDLP